MCTLIVASRVWPRWPLLVAANRDEELRRAAQPPSRRDDGPIPVLAPRDERRGGTWLGLNQRGLFVGITNRFGKPPDHSRRSRGELVTLALAEPSAQAAADAVAVLPAGDFNPFHLFVADRGLLFRLWSDGATLHRRELEPGVHFLTERSLGAAQSAREDALKAALEPRPGGSAPDNARLRALLAGHGDEPFNSVCVHMPEMGYGTRSSTILRLGRDAAEAEMWHADGAPCQNDFVDYSGAARSLLADGD